MRNAIAIGALLLMCAFMVMLARRLRGIAPARLLINLLFPFSQLCIAAFLLYYAIAYDLPLWMFVLIVAVSILCGPVDLVLFKMLGESEERELSRERVRLLEEQLHAQEDYLRRLSADIEEACRVREDVARELSAVEKLLDQREAEQASRGLMRAVGLMDATCKRTCEHRVVDALVSMKAAECDKNDIRLTLNLAVADDIGLSSVELCAVFSNMLDNAINACVKVPEGERFVELSARENTGYLVVHMKNSCVTSESVAHRAPRRRGAALPRHGWGLSILQSLADRHDGKLETAQAAGVFTTTVLLRVDSAADDQLYLGSIKSAS
ncbi:ATP-binding protein [Arabiibacter massiliensis]|uniref:ATP-binding protein n=1 Tax=Arabiibacter massiliensis TaxID=1870985 RepID=UPI0009B93607|nr:ATP-binding protein [Arabiibacter massiliensis]